MRVELVVRFDYGSIVPWVQTRRRRVARDRRARRARAPHAGRSRRRGPDDASREFTVARGRAGAVRARLVPVARSRAAFPTTRRARRRARRSTGGTGRRGARTRAQWREPVLRSLLTLESLTFDADRRHRRRAHHLAAGDARRHAQLGLPLLLGARRDAHARGVDRRRLPRRSRALARVVAARGRGRARAVADDVRRRAASAGSPSSSSTGCPATRARARCAPATPRTSSSSSTCTASSLDVLWQGVRAGMPLERRVVVAGCACCWRRSRSAGASPTRASGRCAGPRRHFTHSKVMCWVAFDRAVAIAEQLGFDGPIDRWRAIRDEIHDAGLRPRATTPRSARSRRRYDSTELDAVGADDPARRLPARRRSARRVDDRAIGAIERGGLTPTDSCMRYVPTARRGRRHRRAAKACSCRAASGWSRRSRSRASTDEAHALFERLLALANDVGLFAEEYDPKRRACSATSRRRSRTSRSSAAAHTLEPESFADAQRRRDRDRGVATGRPRRRPRNLAPWR